jgi:peptide/nickel transport system permease protein
MAGSEDTQGALPTGGRRPNPRLAQYKRTFYFLRRNSLAMVGLGILIFWIIVAATSPLYPAPDDALARYCGVLPGTPANQSPAGCIPVCTYPQGTLSSPGCYQVPAASPSVVAPTIRISNGGISLGPLPLGSLTVSPDSNYFYSVLPGLVKGAPWSLGIAAAVVSSGAVIGLMLGAVAGYAGGSTDEVIMRFTDIFLAIPGLFLVLVTLTVLGSKVGTLDGRVEILIAAFVITWWPLYTRIVRGQVLVTREQKYVEAARASGARRGRIITRHIIPNSMYPVFVQMSLDVGTVPLLLAAIVFLGYQIWPNFYFPEWGTMAAFSVTDVGTFITCNTCTFPWWQIFFPGTCLFLFAISVNFLADGLRDALDPRLRR